jgi:competence protein ComEC
MRRPLLFLAAALALGCWVGDGVPVGVAAFLLAAAAGLLALACCAPLRWAPVALSAAAIGIGAAGAAIERIAYDATPLYHWLEGREDLDEPLKLSGLAALDSGEWADRYVVALDLDSLTVRGRQLPMRGRARILVTGAAPRPEIVEGDRLTVWATLRRPRGFGNPGAFDAEGYARLQGVHAAGSCKSPLLVRHAGGAVPVGLRRLTALARTWARRMLRRAVVPGPEEGLVRAMTLGDRSGLDPAAAQAFRAAGIYHVLAISGAQVALLAGVLLWLARVAGAGPGATGIVVSACLGFYAAFVGAETPVVRSAVMSVTLLLGRALDLDSDLANLLGLSALLLLVRQPSAIGDVAFQLSFLATLGILLLAGPLLRWLPRMPLRLELGLAGSLAAQIALAPLLAAHFHRLAPAALLLNLAAVPLSGAVLFAGFAVVAASGLAPPLAPAAGDLAWIAAHALARSADPVTWMSALDARVPTPGLLAVALLVAGGAVLAQGRGRGLGLAAAGVALMAFGPDAPAGDGRLHVTVLDVGQGDSVVLRSPLGSVWVVDAGSAPEGGLDLGEAVVAPYLWWQGVRRVERLVVTHGHADHAGGAAFLARAMGVREVWEGVWRSEPVTRALAAELHRLGTPRRCVTRGTRVAWDGVDVEVLAPRLPLRSGLASNGDSLVLALRFGQVRLVLAADLEAAQEVALPWEPAAVLKVPHHGARTSSSPAFVSKLAPRVAIVSVGRRNRFGHPDRDVLWRYLSRGARVLRTDRDGAVTVSTDGSRVWLRTFHGGQEERLL